MATSPKALPLNYTSWTEVWEKVIKDGNQNSPTQRYVFAASKAGIVTCQVSELQQEAWQEQQQLEKSMGDCHGQRPLSRE